MNDKPDHTNVSRRNVLKRGLIASGTALVAGSALTGTATARGNLVSKINSSGHYAYFPLGPSNWARQKHPYDAREGDSRWMAGPAPGGGVRCLVENVEIEAIPNRNAGFDIHMGPLGDLAEITIDSETVTTQAGSEALLFVGLYLDEDENGEFFVWADQKGNKDAFAGLGGDEEGLLAISAGGTYTIDDTTEFDLFGRGKSETFGDLTDGNVSGIDGGTPAALYIGVADKDEGGIEEAIINRVDIQRS